MLAFVTGSSVGDLPVSGVAGNAVTDFFCFLQEVTFFVAGYIHFFASFFLVAKVFFSCLVLFQLSKLQNDYNN